MASPSDILILGGTGFIGAALADHLARARKVVALGSASGDLRDAEIAREASVRFEAFLVILTGQLWLHACLLDQIVAVALADSRALVRAEGSCRESLQ